jgi:hypothetical protein
MTHAASFASVGMVGRMSSSPAGTAGYEDIVAWDDASSLASIKFVSSTRNIIAVHSGSFTSSPLCTTGQRDTAWEELRLKEPQLWKDAALKRAGESFAALITAQRAAFLHAKPKPRPDFVERASNPAILAAWVFVAGMLRNNEARLKRHYALASISVRDPLNASALANGRHKTDPANYRGLGYRTDAKERGRLTELFFLQAEKGDGITKTNIDVGHRKVSRQAGAARSLQTRG